jgi:ferrous iron transport protein A
VTILIFNFTTGSARLVPQSLLMPSLLEVPRLQFAIVTRVDGERAFRRRIMEMGLVPGTPVRVVAVAPLGDPLTLELRSSKLSIRKREAALVLVRT